MVNKLNYTDLNLFKATVGVENVRRRAAYHESVHVVAINTC